MRLHFQRVGDGPRPVVLLHGFLGSGRNLGTLARRWSEADPTLTILLPDLTGHGSSPPLPAGATIFETAHDVLETASAAGLPGPYRFVGHSLGGRVSLAALTVLPELVESVTLLDIAPGPLSNRDQTADILAQAPAHFDDRDEARRFLLDRGLAPPIVEWLLLNLEAQDEGGYRWRIERQTLADARPRFNAADLWPTVERRLAPIRAVRGSLSRYVKDDDVQRYEQNGVSVTTIEGAGHFVHVDKPKELLAWLLSH